MKVYNTESKSLETFKEINKGQVLFYHCGPTVYWHQHIGNMRGMTMADIVNRIFQYNGYETQLVRNYTDVGHLTGDNIGDADSGEDRMVKGATRENLTPDKIADKYIHSFDSDTHKLNILDPEIKPRATEYISEMIEFISDLIGKGYAYITPEAVYFDISKVEDYTRLSGQKLNLNKRGAGHGSVAGEKKRNPEDFSLWFFRTGAHEKALQYWESPFNSEKVENGIGFPGWHLECSVMAITELAETIDVHMGGIEHIPIHHTNEIAQSEAKTGKTFVNYWLHNEWLTIEGEKISKSEGNFYLISDLEQRGFHPLSLRYFFLGAHYRSKQNFTIEALTAAQTALINLYKLVIKLQNNSHNSSSKLDNSYIKSKKEEFLKSINEDFNISAGLGLFWEIIKSERTSQLEARELILELIYDFDQVFGLDLKNADTRLIEIENLQQSAKGNSNLTDTQVIEINDLLKERQVFREQKKWAESDRIRDLLREKYQVIIKDTDNGVEWSRI